jgi:NAD(P)-dependent dehydrogenase (short-subunit alcohol dehydrogenase family)
VADGGQAILLARGFDRLPYVASKHAMVAISEALAIYLGPKGIGVTCVCPSRVATNIAEQITTYGEAPSPRPRPQTSGARGPQIWPRSLSLLERQQLPTAVSTLRRE